MIDLDLMNRGYLECLLWTESCNGWAAHEGCFGEDCDSSLLDIGYTTDSLMVSDMECARRGCQDFVALCESYRPDCFDGLDSSQVGHDFALTRNHHGAGFWDRGLGELGDFLTRQAHTFGEASAFVSADDRKFVGYQA